MLSRILLFQNQSPGLRFSLVCSVELDDCTGITASEGAIISLFAVAVLDQSTRICLPSNFSTKITSQESIDSDTEPTV